MSSTGPVPRHVKIWDNIEGSTPFISALAQQQGEQTLQSCIVPLENQVPVKWHRPLAIDCAMHLARRPQRLLILSLLDRTACVGVLDSIGSQPQVRQQPGRPILAISSSCLALTSHVCVLCRAGGD